MFRQFYPHSFIALLCVACTAKQTPALSKINLSPTAQLLVEKRWVEADVFVIHNPDTVSRDITRQFPQQERDDVLILADNGTYKYDEGTTKFNTLHKQVLQKGTGLLMNPKRFCYYRQMAQLTNMKF